MNEHSPFGSLTRVQPFSGLVIDPDTWATAHDYHRSHHRLHLLTMHGAGIAQGLQVLPGDPPSATLIVDRGIAIDPAGNVVLIPEMQRVAVEPRAGTTYIVLDYVESAPSTGDGDQREVRGRLVEDFRLRASSEPPAAPALELARVQLDGAAQPAIGAAPNPWEPGVNEIDLRFRSQLNAQPARPLTVAYLPIEGADDQQPDRRKQGFFHLLRELQANGIPASPVVSANGDVPQADIFLAIGSGSTRPPKPVITGLEERLHEGAWLFADSAGGGDAFMKGFAPLLKLRRQTDATDAAGTESSVLGARHVFGAAPPGAHGPGSVAWGPRAFISSRDYCAAWAGLRGDEPLDRQLIRDALEFAVNFGVAASASR